MLHNLQNYFDDFLQLLYPELCNCCGKKLVRGEKVICLKCEHDLFFQPFHEAADNWVTQRFYGRVPIENGAAMFLFTKGGVVQHLIHQLKYKDKKEVGDFLGELYGRMLMKEEAYRKVDIIVPVPLHPEKLKKRGYNQSEHFARGLSKEMKKPVVANVLHRLTLKESQTRKKRMARWTNVDSDFYLKKSDSISGKHILLVDDVLTTGSTIDACSQALLTAKDVKISLATIAITSRI